MIKKPEKKGYPLNGDNDDLIFFNGYDQALEESSAYYEELLSEMKGHYEGCQSLFKGGYRMNVQESIMYEPVNNLAKKLGWDDE